MMGGGWLSSHPRAGAAFMAAMLVSYLAFLIVHVVRDIGTTTHGPVLFVGGVGCATLAAVFARLWRPVLLMGWLPFFATMPVRAVGAEPWGPRVLLFAAGWVIAATVQFGPRIARAFASVGKSTGADGELGFELTPEEAERPAPPTPTEEEKRGHLVRIYDVRPFKNDPDQYETYFIALCACDWVGEPKATEAEAIADAHTHSSNVAAGLVRPVG